MADNELDKSIEELEAEVLAELEEAAHDAPTKGAVPAEPMKKTKNGEVQDLGKAVTDPMQKAAPSKKASASAKEVGGDFYDFFLIDKKHLCFVIGDVSDKGVPAALFMALTKSQIKGSSSRRRTPGDVLMRANNYLCQENESGM